MRRLFLILALLLGAVLPTLAPTSARAHGHHGWGRGWGHHGWNGGWGYGRHRYYGGWGGGWNGWGGYHRNWGWGRGYVARPFYRPYHGVGFGGFYPAVNYGFYPTYNYGYYPNYGYPVFSNYYYGCDATPTITIPSVDVEPMYNAQLPLNRTIVNYAGNQGGLSTELTDGMLIARLADALRQRGNSSQATTVNNRLLIGNGRLQGVVQNGALRNIVQNITGNSVRNESFTTGVRISNVDSRSKARAYMAQGDTLFREQRYAAAAQQYRAAASMAPDLAEANWRYGHALVAMGEYDLAANAMRKAIAASADTTRGGFTLDTLYGTVGLAKASHLEGLAKAAIEEESANAYFLLGVTLHYGGEATRAEKFFAQAAELHGPDSPHLVAFLGPASSSRVSSRPAVSAPVAVPTPRETTTRFVAQET